jgi:hypothetical protein
LEAPKASGLAILASSYNSPYVRTIAFFLIQRLQSMKLSLGNLARRRKAESIRDAISESKAAAVWIMLVHAGR